MYAAGPYQLNLRISPVRPYSSHTRQEHSILFPVESLLLPPLPLPAHPAPSTAGQILSAPRCLQPWQGDREGANKTGHVFPTGWQHTHHPPWASGHLQGWAEAVPSVDLCAHCWRPKSSAHQDTGTRLLAPGLMGEAFFHVIATVQGKSLVSPSPRQ